MVMVKHDHTEKQNSQKTGFKKVIGKMNDILEIRLLNF